MNIRRRAQSRQSDDRSAVRTDFRVDITLSSEHTLYYGVTRDIAEGGLFVCTYDAIPIGTELTLKIELPDHGPPLSLLGRVQWVREHSPINDELPPGIGVKFLTCDSKGMERVQRFLTFQEPLLYE